MSNSRFNRTSQTSGSDRETATEPATPTTTPTARGPATMDTNFQALTERLEQLRARRSRREFELETAEKEIQFCQEQAAVLGVNSLDELRELVEKQKAEDAEALEAFVAALDAEQQLLDTIDRRMSEAQGG